jgi:hypothetical protein
VTIGVAGRESEHVIAGIHPSLTPW